MTNGIEVRDRVRMKALDQVATVVGVDDHHERYPADLHVVYVDPWGEECLAKIRVDEVEKI